MTRLSRRELLKRAGWLGAAAAAAPAIVPASPTASSQATAAATALVREPLETLTAIEADILEAVVARLIPSDATGPGAREARAAHYIDRALGGALAAARDAYSGGLAALDAYARTSRGAPFVQLSAADQDLVLTDVESGAATGFGASSSIFFELVRNHTIQGTFCDPFYGGNASFAGWDLIGYPGVRTVVSPDEQRMGVTLKPNHRSAYDYGMFTTATARNDAEEHPTHGD
jgi:gluconate 2-dehydrogenase gamma chain